MNANFENKTINQIIIENDMSKEDAIRFSKTISRMIYEYKASNRKKNLRENN